MASAITNIVEYSRGMHQSLVSKSPESKSSGADSISDELPYLAQSHSLDYVPSRNPVQKAKRYSPQHLESIAYMMASDSLSKRADDTKPRNISSWSLAKKPPARPTTTSPNQQPHQNGRVHDATVETRHFAHMMAITGWKGESRNNSTMNICSTNQAKFPLHSSTTWQTGFITHPRSSTMMSQFEDEITSPDSEVV
jgi:hypothetical protein